MILYFHAANYTNLKYSVDIYSLQYLFNGVHLDQNIIICQYSQKYVPDHHQLTVSLSNPLE